MSPPAKITLTKTQIAFVKHMTEIDDADEAVRKFATIMSEEKVPSTDMAAVIDRILVKMRKK